MKELSLFLLKNYLGAKMRKGLKTFCNGDACTSTLNQQHYTTTDSPNLHIPANTKSLEEMILELELEEEIARKEKLNAAIDGMRGRMSSVNNSDILRSARNALNQYPRFSLDGKDAMYRASFRNLDHGLRRGRMYKADSCLPPVLAGESVVWCKPGVVAKLMGIEAMPVPVNSNGKQKMRNSRRKSSCSKTLVSKGGHVLYNNL